MNRWFRILFFYGIIFLVLFSGINLVTGENNDAEELNVQEFMEALNTGEATELTMQPVNKIYRVTGTLSTDQTEFVAQVPDNPDIISNITDLATEQSILNVEEEEQPSAFVSFLTMMLPFLLIGLLLFFFLTRAKGG